MIKACPWEAVELLVHRNSGHTVKLDFILDFVCEKAFVCRLGRSFLTIRPYSNCSQGCTGSKTLGQPSNACELKHSWEFFSPTLVTSMSFNERSHHHDLCKNGKSNDINLSSSHAVGLKLLLHEYHNFRQLCAFFILTGLYAKCIIMLIYLDILLTCK